MAMVNPAGRINYEPNSRGENGGPRESPQVGFHSAAVEEAGQKVRERSQSFADHYSQARQFFISQTKGEQGHIADALVFELSKVEEPAIRERMVSHLPNIDAKLADRVAKGLGMTGKISAAKAAIPARNDLAKSKPLSIVLNPPESFKGRKVGALLTDGSDGTLVAALRAEVEAEGAMLEIIAPTIAGVQLSDGTHLKADHKIGGGPSVLFDAVAILPSREGVLSLANNASAAEFAADAFGHLKFIAWIQDATPLFEKAGISGALDKGCIELIDPKSAGQFVALCRKLRFWEREQKVTF
jgi:catalase